MLDFPEYLKIFAGLVAIANPIGVIPLFISMTAGDSMEQRRRTIHLMAIGFSTTLLASLFFGEVLLKFFGISIDSFRVGGGILILLMAIAMLHARTSPVIQSSEEADESIEKESVAIVPLTIPLLAGPGAISTVILAGHRSSAIAHSIVIASSIFVLTAMIWAALRLSPWITTRISATGINIFTRIMGLILTAIAVEFIANGVKGLFPVLA